MPCFFFSFMLTVWIAFIWVDVVAWQALRSSPSRRFGLGALALLGLLIGVYCGCFLIYPVSPTRRLCSFPLPAAIFQLEGGRWVDYVSPFTPVIAIYNILLVAAFAPFPYALSVAIKERRIKGRCQYCGYDLTGNTSGVCPECGVKA